MRDPKSNETCICQLFFLMFLYGFWQRHLHYSHVLFRFLNDFGQRNLQFVQVFLTFLHGFWIQNLPVIVTVRGGRPITNIKHIECFFDWLGGPRKSPPRAQDPPSSIFLRPVSLSLSIYIYIYIYYMYVCMHLSIYELLISLSLSPPLFLSLYIYIYTLLFCSVCMASVCVCVSIYMSGIVKERESEGEGAEGERRDGKRDGEPGWAHMTHPGSRPQQRPGWVMWGLKRGGSWECFLLCLIRNCTENCPGRIRSSLEAISLLILFKKP